ncbi:MAG TPA: site-specific integrase [Pyrinomonadaceae bacterium]|nr:site-specific integrase [Pyrinomonadaceae bacterium]
MAKSKRFYTYDAPGGKLWAYRREYKGQQLRKKGFSTKAAAEQHLTDAMADIDAAERGEVRFKPSTVLDAYNLYKEQQEAVMRRKNYRYGCNERAVLKLFYTDFVLRVGQNKLLRQVTKHDVNMFIDWISFKRDERGEIIYEDGKPVVRMQPQTMQSRTRRLISMLRLAQRVLPDMATWQVPYVKLKRVENERVRTIEAHERVALYEILYNPPHSPHKNVGKVMHAVRITAWRDAGDLCKILFATGTRINEALVLKQAQINWNDETVRIYATKTESERTIPMSLEMIDVLKRRAAEGLSNDTFIFPRCQSVGHINAITKNIRRAATLAGLDYGRKKDGVHGFTPHSFRHTFICDLLELLGGDAKAVMKLSGHKNYASFQMYLHARRETMERARDVIRSRDGNLTGAPGNGVSVGIGGTATVPPSHRHKLPKTPALRVSSGN